MKPLLIILFLSFSSVLSYGQYIGDSSPCDTLHVVGDTFISDSVRYVGIGTIELQIYGNVGGSPYPNAKLKVQSELSFKIEKHNAKIDLQVKELSLQIDSLIQLKDSLKGERIFYYKDLDIRNKLKYFEQ